ncbi:fatty acyl-CoA reductase 2, chloroplastic-like [Spinacia oleracea]|uniref:Fatty acyl-CoA reductase n=1 Tax=Spinacia oleracea TaxID=3562 RepID=A0A9R0IU48_SPIOL|nr:fatty acyl-CoA reductase 2, chloroplastic-like [Spinacia oleracea]
MSNKPNVDGVGIINFLKFKSFFITGSTGFIAKVFVEKLLREVPDVQKIFLLVRAKNEEAAMQRLKTEIIDCELFTRLKEAYGERYEELMRSKLVPVVGNICDPWLGMNTNDVRVIADQVNVIISIAGTTKWHERFCIMK